MVKKTIYFDVMLKSSDRINLNDFKARQKVMTNDKNSVDIVFRATDVEPDDLKGATASIFLYMQDGSFFQSNSVVITNNVLTYTMTQNQTQHKGTTKVQIVVKSGTIDNASLLQEFEISPGLEKYPLTEVMIQDWTTLTAEAKAFVDQIEGFTLESFVENKMGQELANLEVNYATRLTGLESKDAQLTAQLAETKKHVNTKSFFVDDYSSYKLGSDWSPAIDLIYNEIVALGGGNVVFSNGSYNISRPLPVVSYISYIGQGYKYTLLKYTSSDSNNIVTINVKNVTLRDLTLQGNSGQLGHGISVTGTPTIPTGETTLDNLRLANCGKSGLYVGTYVWMNIGTNLRFDNNDEHGFFDQGTDNTFSNLHASGNTFHGLYLAGRNGRYSNIKSIYNGSGGEAYAGIYISGGRLQLSNLEAQDNNYDGIVFDGCIESVASNLISDASGWAYESGITPIISARGFVFKNNCHHITAKGLYACCYYVKKTQKRGLDVDSSCSFLNIEFDQNEKVFVNDYLSSSNLAVDVKTPNTIMLQKYLGTDKLIYNLITQPLLTSNVAFIGSVGATSKTYADGVATIVFGSDSPRRVDFNNAPLKKGHLYYFSVDICASEITELTVSVFKNKNTTPPYNNIESKKVMGNNDYINVSFLIYLFDDDTNYYLTVGSSANSTIYLKQPICVDITEDLGVVCNPTKRYTFDTKFIDELIRKTGGFFATSKVI